MFSIVFGRAQLMSTPSEIPAVHLTALTLTLSHAGSGKGEGSLFSIVFGRPEAMTTP